MSTPTGSPPPATSPLALLAGIGGAAGGWAVSKYAGPALWLPLIATGLLMLIFNKTPLKPRYFSGAIAVTGGHVIWFVAASLMLHDWSSSAPDLVLLTAGMIWLWVRPGLAPVVFLGLFQLASLVVNGLSISAVAVGTPEHRALTVHCLWRALALLCLGVGYRNMRRDRGQAQALALAPVDEGERG